MSEPRTDLFAELDAFAAELGERLVPPDATAPMRVAVEPFARAEPELAFEIHLDAAPRVDLTVRLKRRRRDRVVPGESLTPAAERLLRAWNDPASAIAAVPFVEFEFDLPDHPAAPWIGPAVEPSLRSGPRVIQRERDERERLGQARPTLALDVLDLLGDAPVTDATRARLLEAQRELPRWGLIGQVARLDGRPSAPREGVRVFASMPRSGLRRYLERLEWPGAWAGLDAQLERLAPRADWVDLDFGIHGGRIEPRLGHYLEFRGPRASTSELRRALGSLAERVSDGRGVAEAIHAWVGRIDGRADRVLTLKHAVDGDSEPAAKVYSSRLRPAAQSYDGYARTPT